MLPHVFAFLLLNERGFQRRFYPGRDRSSKAAELLHLAAPGGPIRNRTLRPGSASASRLESGACTGNAGRRPAGRRAI